MQYIKTYEFFKKDSISKFLKSFSSRKDVKIGEIYDVSFNNVLSTQEKSDRKKFLVAITGANKESEFLEELLKRLESIKLTKESIIWFSAENYQLDKQITTIKSKLTHFDLHKDIIILNFSNEKYNNLYNSGKFILSGVNSGSLARTLNDIVSILTGTHNFFQKKKTVTEKSWYDCEFSKLNDSQILKEQTITLSLFLNTDGTEMDDYGNLQVGTNFSRKSYDDLLEEISEHNVLSKRICWSKLETSDFKNLETILNNEREKLIKLGFKVNKNFIVIVPSKLGVKTMKNGNLYSISGLNSNSVVDVANSMTDVILYRQKSTVM